MAMDEQERVHHATPKHREEARAKGQLVQSRDVTSAFMLLGGSLWLLWAGHSMGGHSREFMAGFLSRSLATPLDESAVYQLIVTALTAWLHVVVPFAAFLVAVAAAASFAQRGWFWSTAPLAPRWSILNPLNGLRQLASLASFVELAKSLVKFVVLGVVLFVLVRRNLDAMLTLVTGDPSRALGTVVSLLGEFGLWGGGAIAIVGAVDYGYRFWEHERKLRMTHKELQDEVKQSEGNPMIKSRIRSLQRERARKRMMADVKTADVVITNPTELAIAMVYRHGEMAAPKVVAKGAGVIAQRIREIARAHGVPLVENKPLTRALFGVVDVGGLIPSQFYRAVAEVLAYVYRLKGKAQ